MDTSTPTPRPDGSIWHLLEPLLDRVQKPARYIGCEDGAQVPVHTAETVAWLLCYPDTYEVGFPNQGLQILYEILNERADAVAERSFAPWTDMEEQLRAEGLPLFSLDTHRAAGDFDIIGFNLAAELTYTNVLNMIDLAGLAVRSADRDAHADADHLPLIVLGGHCTYNPEPLADYADLVALGDGEEIIGDITEVLGAWKRTGRPGGRQEVLRRLSAVPGVYVPALYDALPDAVTGAPTRRVPKEVGTPEVVDKRTIVDLGQWPYPKQQLVPLTEVVHDRLNVEVFRGCTRGCRFCQAGMITRPVRERPAEQVRTMIRDGLKRTGYDEVTLTSLSSADYSGIGELVEDIVAGGICGDQAAVALPSLRVDAFTVGLAAEIAKVRRTGLTFAPEGGTWRMRKVINKLIREEDLYGAVESAFSSGWRRVKLYFLIGLPTETDEDVLGIIELAKNCVKIGRKHFKGATVTVSVGGFVPKAQTPFQWFGMDDVDTLERKVRLLREASWKTKGIDVKWHSPAASVAEGITSRGDRRIGAVVERVWRDGGVFQEWGEHFDMQRWLDALEAEGLSVDEVCHRDRTRTETLPWAHLSAGLHEDFLWGDWQDALAEATVEDCRWTPCYDCGACTTGALEHVVASNVPPAGGSQGTGVDLSRGGDVPIALLTRPPKPATADEQTSAAGNDG